MRSILIYQSGSSGVRPHEGGWSHKSFQIIMNSWLGVEAAVCVYVCVCVCCVAFLCFESKGEGGQGVSAIEISF